MHRGLKEPHIFNAASNPIKLIRNLAGVLLAAEIDKIRAEVDSNVLGLFRLGESHYHFANTLAANHWRQRISRLYYGAYNVRRAIQLKHDGSFSTDSTDHQRIDDLPDALLNVATYKAKLRNLRDDRNLADYNHLAQEDDLLNKVSDYDALVAAFIADGRAFLAGQGVVI